MGEHALQRCELTNMCLIRDEVGRVLLQLRTKKDWPGWTLPGGHIEPGEDFREAVIREVREETGLTILNPKLAGVMEFHRTRPDQDRYLVFIYQADKFTGTLSSTSEGRVEFKRYDDVDPAAWAPDMEEIMEVCYFHNYTGITYPKGEPGDCYLW